jgi:hypothetical protein
MPDISNVASESEDEDRAGKYGDWEKDDGEVEESFELVGDGFVHGYIRGETSYSIARKRGKVPRLCSSSSRNPPAIQQAARMTSIPHAG